MSTSITPVEKTHEPHALGTPPEAYRSTLEVLKKVGAKSILDCCAGQGAFSRMLLGQKYDIKCCDVYPDDFLIEDVPCEYANLNDKIPFDDGQFDALTCLNALQRIWARGRALSEMARVVKPGGHIVLTWFNNNNLMRRAMFLTTGSIIADTCGPPLAFVPDMPNPEASFRYPITVGDVVLGLKGVNLELTSLDAVIWSKSSIALAPLALIPLLMRSFAPGAYQKYCAPQQSSSAKILFKDCIVVVARKPGGQR